MEVLASALNEDHRFPSLEIFAFAFVVGTLVFSFNAITRSWGPVPPEAVACNKVLTLNELLLVLVLITLKNIAYGLGSDLEKGVIQTYLCYPLKRRAILTARLLSSIGVPFTLLLGIQILAFSILFPETIASYPGTVMLTYAGILSYYLLLLSLAFILTLVLKKGSVALVGGILLYFASLILTGFIGYASYITDSDLLVKIHAVLMPSVAVLYHYRGDESWSPSLAEASLYVGAGYALVFLVFAIGYLYFEKRLEA